MKKLFCLLLFLPIYLSYAQDVSQIPIDDFGNHAVGYKHFIIRDSSRTFLYQSIVPGEAMPRPVSVSMWYPAVVSDYTARMKVSDYLSVHAAEQEWKNLPQDQLLNWFQYRNTPQNKARMDMNTHCTKDPRAANGSFPVILYTPGLGGTSVENFVLCEYLASHGFIVLAHPSLGAESLYPQNADGRLIDAQTRDLELVLASALQLENIDHSKIAVMGFSFGGMAGVLAQMRNEYISAIVSLDGSIRYQYEKLTKSVNFDIDRVDVPFIHFAQKDIPADILKAEGLESAINSEFLFYDDLQFSEAYKLKMHSMTHLNFSAMEILLGTRDPKQDFPDEEIIAGYGAMSKIVLLFLNSYLNDDQEALLKLKEVISDGRYSRDLLTGSYKSSQAKSINEEDFNLMASARGYQGIGELYDSLESKVPGFKVSEGQLNSMALRWLFNSGRPENGIALLQLATSLYPSSSNLYDSLGEGFLVVNNKQKAVEAFRRSIALDASNMNASNRLKSLEAE